MIIFTIISYENLVAKKRIAYTRRPWFVIIAVANFVVSTHFDRIALMHIARFAERILF